MLPRNSSQVKSAYSLIPSCSTGCSSAFGASRDHTATRLAYLVGMILRVVLIYQLQVTCENCLPCCMLLQSTCELLLMPFISCVNIQHSQPIPQLCNSSVAVLPRLRTGLALRAAAPQYNRMLGESWGSFMRNMIQMRLTCVASRCKVWLGRMPGAGSPAPATESARSTTAQQQRPIILWVAKRSVPC